MAGRLELAITPDELRVWARLDDGPLDERLRLPRYNTTPRHALPVLTADRRVVAMRWGFPQMWKPKPWDVPPLFNAQSETAASKPVWSKPLRERRCVVPVSGFYEWLDQGGEKLPLRFAASDGGILALAGIWGAFDWGEKKGWPCVSILTCAPTPYVAPVHDRMPCLVDDVDAWLDLGTLPPPRGDALVAIEANRRVGSIDQDDPGLRDADWTRLTLP